jgi:hypothetical protein
MIATTANEKTYTIEAAHENDGNEQWYAATLFVPHGDTSQHFDLLDPWSNPPERTLTVGAAIAAGVAAPELLEEYREGDILDEPEMLLPEVRSELEAVLAASADEYYNAEISNRSNEIMEAVEGKNVALYAIYSPRGFANELDGLAVLEEDREAFGEWKDSLDFTRCWAESGDKEWFEGKLIFGIKNLVEAERCGHNVSANPPEGVQDLQVWIKNNEG